MRMSMSMSRRGIMSSSRSTTTSRVALVALLSLVSTCHALTSQSARGREILNQATRRLDDGDFDFVGDYSIKFQGCHHVQQWNDNADQDEGDEDGTDVKIKTKRLARFRLCPADQCSNDRTSGCTSKFGDYIVDMNTFVYNYMTELEEQKENVCADATNDCQEKCNGDGDCMTDCYAGYEMSYCEYDEAEANGFDVAEFTECAEMPNGNRRGRRRLDNNDVQYYIGPHCSAQGGEVRLGVFTDDTCTTMAEYGDDVFYNANGFNLPYSTSSMVSSRCIACSNNGDNDDGNNNNGQYQVSEMCQDVYKNSGKCETRMTIDYPNESSCDYIEGIKVIREDGVIRTSSVRKSKSAAVAIGVFMTLSVLLAGYVFYLRTKLGRAQINLAASAQPLT